MLLWMFLQMFLQMFLWIFLWLPMSPAKRCHWGAPHARRARRVAGMLPHSWNRHAARVQCWRARHPPVLNSCVGFQKVVPNALFQVYLP